MKAYEEDMEARRLPGHLEGWQCSAAGILRLHSQEAEISEIDLYCLLLFQIHI